MTVQNFLEDEDYEAAGQMPSGVPNYLADEEEDTGAPWSPDESNPALSANQAECDEAEPEAPSREEWRRQVERGEVKGHEHPNRGKDPNSPTKKKRKPGTKYHRRDITEKDLLVLAFLERFKLATTKQIGILLGVKRGSANWRMLGLMEIGLVAQEKIPTMPVLWYLKPKGKRTLDNAFHFDERAPKSLHEPGRVSPGNISHTLFEAQICAGMKPLGKIPGQEMLSGLGVLRQIVDETFIRSAWGKAVWRKGDGDSQQADRGFKIRQQVSEGLQRGELKWSEALAENPSLWTLTVPFIERSRTKEFHYPDLVVDLEHLREGHEPVSYAVELELSPKSPQELKKILMTFKVAMGNNPVPVYRKVIYLIPDEGVKRGVVKAAKEVGLTPDQLLILAVADFEGKRFTGKAWDL
ncbi:hypothetical protein PFZ49_00870 [Microbacterium lacticum]|uniref:hypothetical protein n=1 Tax=Microbacterium lacticum TaxID=33885 RepID=UPI003A844086